MTPLRVLVVDDNRDALYLLQKQLEQFNCDIRTCQDSTQAVHMIQEFTPQVIFLDIDMPQVDGFEIAEDLRGLKLPEFLLVATTSFTDQDHRRECEAAGFEIFLPKPLSLEQVQTVIDEASRRFLKTT